MKKEDVPQDESTLGTKNIRELYYVVEENGNYTTELSTGWKPKTIALNNALETLEERAQAAKERVEQGISSPIEYYMEVNRMDIPTLAAYANMWQWQVKRHLKPRVFNRLSDRKLQKYATTFDITVEQLKDITKTS